MAELKSCPFCGSGAAMNTVRYAADSETAKLNGQSLFYGVNCISCGTNNLGLVGHKTEESAIAAWNRRATDGQRADDARDAADPLQGAADWLVKSLDKPRPAEIAAHLLIGHNRAERLFDAAIAKQRKGGD
ncbi:Lar family restriction alleviation protein [Bordetella hinzii]|uniref:Lar family restriction alleviation protein n=1 Tax=Bordetella hinzii TaxID=103855 RepID=UPI0039FBA386